MYLSSGHEKRCSCPHISFFLRTAYPPSIHKQEHSWSYNVTQALVYTFCPKTEYVGQLCDQRQRWYYQSSLRQASTPDQGQSRELEWELEFLRWRGRACWVDILIGAHCMSYSMQKVMAKKMASWEDYSKSYNTGGEVRWVTQVRTKISRKKEN